MNIPPPHTNNNNEKNPWLWSNNLNLKRICFSHTYINCDKKNGMLLIAETLHHLRSSNPCKSWDKLPTSTGERRISEPSTVSLNDHNMHALVYCLSIRNSEMTHDKFMNYLECLQTILLLSRETNITMEYPMFVRKIIFKRSIFHCYVSLPECSH